jgi:diketogulonate reductase-like aldo/keto reductase
MNDLARTSIITLQNGIKIPILGLGVWQMENGDETGNAVRWALEAGYRHIDTAALYGNEESVGLAVRESGIPRSEIFVTTKLWPTDYLNPQKGFDTSMKRLGLDYVDLYLVHWPIPLMTKSVWHAMEKIYASGRAKAIGISNYGIKNIEDLLSYATVLPAVNQVKFSPFNYDAALHEYCRSKKIALEAYSPLTRGKKLGDEKVKMIAEKYHKSPAQILIRWCIEHQIVVIPKSSNKERIIENADVFDFSISPEDMKTLNNLS